MLFVDRSLIFVMLFGIIKLKKKTTTVRRYANELVSPRTMRHLISRHDEVIKWKHFPRNWPFVRGIHWSPVNSPYKGQWRGALMFSLINVWINGWVNNRKAGIWDAILPIMTSLYENVPSDWPLSLHEDYSVVSRTTFLATVQWWNKKLQQVIERKLDTTTIILFFLGGGGGGRGHSYDNNFVLYGSIFFIYIPKSCFCTVFIWYYRLSSDITNVYFRCIL